MVTRGFPIDRLWDDPFSQRVVLVDQSSLRTLKAEQWTANRSDMIATSFAWISF